MSNAQNAPLVYAVHNDKGEWMTNTRLITREDDGIWVWFGFVKDGSARVLTAGDEIHYMDEDFKVQTGTLVRTNRVTITIRTAAGSLIKVEA